LSIIPTECKVIFFVSLYCINQY